MTGAGKMSYFILFTEFYYGDQIKEDEMVRERNA